MIKVPYDYENRGDVLMKNNHKNLFLFVFVSLLVFFALVQFASAQESVVDSISNTISKIFGKTGEGLKTGISQFLLTVLVILLVYTISTAIPFLKEDNNKGIRWWVSIIIGVLSFMFVPSGDIKAILVGYEALGIVLTSIVPLVVILVFTAKFYQERPILARYLNPMIILGFIIYCIVKWVNLKDTNLGWLYVATIIPSILWVFIGPWIIGKLGLDEKMAKFKEMNTKLEKSVEFVAGTAKSADNLAINSR